MAGNLSFSSSLTFILYLILSAQRTLGQATTNAFCVTGSYDWARNSQGKSPCLVAAELAAVCNGGSYHIERLQVATNNTYPFPSAATQNRCLCSTVVYSLFQACSYCQNGASDNWSEWAGSGCASSAVGYPEAIPTGTLVQGWAYIDPTRADAFDLQGAEGNSTLPESTPGPAPTGAASTINPQATTTPSNNSRTPASSQYASSTTSASADSKKASTTPIIAGVVGGIVALLVIGVLVFFLLRRRTRKRNSPKKIFPTGLDGDVEESQSPAVARNSGDDDEKPPEPVPYVLRQELLPPPGEEEPATRELSEKRRLLLVREQGRLGQNRLPEVGSFPAGARSDDGDSEEDGPGPSSARAAERPKATATTSAGETASPTIGHEQLSEHDLSRLASKVVSMMATSAPVVDPELPPSYQPR